MGSAMSVLNAKEFEQLLLTKDRLVSLPDMSGLEGLEIKYDGCEDRLRNLLNAWDAGGRKTLSS